MRNRRRITFSLTVSGAEIPGNGEENHAQLLIKARTRATATGKRPGSVLGRGSRKGRGARACRPTSLYLMSTDSAKTRDELGEELNGRRRSVRNVP